MVLTLSRVRILLSSCYFSAKIGNSQFTFPGLAADLKESCHVLLGAFLAQEALEQIAFIAKALV